MCCDQNLLARGLATQPLALEQKRTEDGQIPDSISKYSEVVLCSVWVVFAASMSLLSYICTAEAQSGRCGKGTT